MQTQDNNSENTNDQSCLSAVSSSAFVIVDMKGHIDGVTLTEQTAIDYVEEYNKTVDDIDDKIKYEVVEVF